jgi:hypothetical protein
MTEENKLCSSGDAIDDIGVQRNKIRYFVKNSVQIYVCTSGSDKRIVKLFL